MADNEGKESKKEQCSECKQWVKKIDEENGLCGGCLKKFE
jgi:predicted amidophosphoribosyltransferase